MKNMKMTVSMKMEIKTQTKKQAEAEEEEEERERKGCAVPGKDSHNNTIRTLEQSLLATDTDGHADTESGTSRECAVRVPKFRQPAD